ncbi:hypothetical protein FOZ60_016244 [Perkinsus olseni]|uniref:Peptidase A2 domain-containing protein n=1 Tax=Perkinsus olseni TaxID=32597 RepID=A0A7J6N4N1_PEROL|nr:hypothetical protein FOZ60_016244 [Perkinsus olseni]
MSRRSPRLNDPVNVPVPNDPVNDSTPEGSQIPPPQASVQHLVNNDPANNSLAGQTSTSTSTPPQETTGNTNATLPATNPTGQTSTSSSTPPQETTGNTNATLPATNPAGQTSTSSSAPPQETAGNTNPILPATVNLPHTSITATSPAVVPPNPAVGPPTDTASGDQPTGSGSSSPRVNLVDYTSYYHHYEDTSRYHNSDNDWYYSHGWKKKGTRSDVKKIYNDVAWMKHVLGQPWKGSGDSCSLLEFRNKLTCSAEYKWADPCSRYFILKHNLSESIQRLLDGYEADNEVDMARFSDPLGSDSPYWLECSEQVWSFLERTYAGLDGDRLEERWSSQWLSKGSTWLEFYSTFDSVGRQLAKSRGIERLSDQEQRCRLYQALPHACQVYLNERGYRQVGSMPFPKMIECVQAWCETHWDHKQVKVTALSTDTKERWNGYEDRSNYSKDIGGNISTGALPEKRGYRKFPPRSQRLREDAKILADDYNKSVLAAKCGRCLSSEGGHTAISCCQQLDRPEIRCPFCGLKHSDYQLCPQDFDTYGKDCGRCGRRHHGPWACKAPTPSSRVISAVSLSPMSVEDPVLTVTLGRSTTPYQALVDTGAQISVLSSSVLKDLGLVDLQPTPLTLTTADWSRPSVKGIIKNLPVYLPQGRVVYLDFLVSAQDLTRQVILSASFLRELDAVWLVGKSRLIFEAGANGITQQLYNLGRPTSSSKPVDPALQGVVELCNLALSTTAESTSTPVLPDDLATDIVTSQFPSDQSKELTAGAVVPSVIPTHEGHDSDDFTWDLAPPTPRSKLGRFVLHVPWKGDDRPTGGYNSTAARRAFSTDARLSASERSDYLEVVRGLVEEGFVVPADEDVEPVSSHVGIYVDDTHARGETKEEALYYADRLDSGLASHGFGSNAIKRLLSWAHDPSTYLWCFKIAMAFYDPLGLGVEYAVALRAMVREACSSSVGWDDLVESSLAAKLVAKLSRRDLSTVVQKVYFYTDSEVSIYRLRRKASGLRLKLITPLESRRLQDTAEVLRPYRVTAASDAGTVYYLSTPEGKPLRYSETFFNLKPYVPSEDFIDSYQESEAADDDILMADPHEVAENMVNP